MRQNAQQEFKGKRWKGGRWGGIQYWTIKVRVSARFFLRGGKNQKKRGGNVFTRGNLKNVTVKRVVRRGDLQQECGGWGLVGASRGGRHQPISKVNNICIVLCNTSKNMEKESAR